MARVSIIRTDNMVVVDGVARKVDLSRLLPAEVHAIQWGGEKGHIEYVAADRSNETLTDTAALDDVLAAWDAAAPPPPSADRPDDRTVEQKIADAAAVTVEELRAWRDAKAVVVTR